MAKKINYWKVREANALKAYQKQELEYESALRQIYANQIYEMEREINDFYSKYANAEGISISDAKMRISKADLEYLSRKAADYVKNKDFSDKANAEMRLYNAMMRINRLEMLKARLGLELVAGSDAVDKNVQEWLAKRAEEEAQRQAGILGKSAITDPKVVGTIVNASFHNATFSDRIWANQGALRDELSKLIQSGIVQGKNPRALAATLRKAFDASRYNSERLLRTELARIQTDIQMRSFEANGFEEYQFIANHNDGKTCDICKSLDGKIFKVKDAEVGENLPPMHPNCRCSTAAYMDDETYRNWLDGCQEHGLSFEDWLDQYNLNISSPGSTRSFVRSLEDIAKGRAGLDKRRSGIAQRLKSEGNYTRYKKHSISERDLAYLSAATGVEFSLFRSKNEDILVRGSIRHCNVSGDLAEEIVNRGYEWVAHSHVDKGRLRASQDDRRTLRKLGQSKSLIIGIDGNTHEFWEDEFHLE